MHITYMCRGNEEQLYIQQKRHNARFSGIVAQVDAIAPSEVFKTQRGVLRVCVCMSLSMQHTLHAYSCLFWFFSLHTIFVDRFDASHETLMIFLLRPSLSSMVSTEITNARLLNDLQSVYKIPEIRPKTKALYDGPHLGRTHQIL